MAVAAAAEEEEGRRRKVQYDGIGLDWLRWLCKMARHSALTAPCSLQVIPTSMAVAGVDTA